MVKRYSTSDVSERIMVSARELFTKNGYEGTSIRDIAAASGANIAHIKYYYGSKYNLFEIIFDEAFEILVKRIFSIVDSDMTFFEMIEEWVNLYYEVIPQYPQIPIFILNEINHSPEALIEKILKRDPERIFTRLAEKMEEERTKGTIQNIPDIDIALNILSLCVFPFAFRGIATKVACKTDEEYNKILKDHRKYVIDFIMRGLKP